MSYLICIPFIIQAVASFFDEFYFHHKRGLGRWERIGHPIDSISVLICFLFAYFVPWSPSHFYEYLAIAGFSCILVTKDEFVHIHQCAAGEAWLHAVLFVLHPIMLASVGVIWYFTHAADAQALSLQIQPDFNPTFFKFVLESQIGMIFLYIVYQITYWSFIREPHAKLAR